MGDGTDVAEGKGEMGGGLVRWTSQGKGRDGIGSVADHLNAAWIWVAFSILQIMHQHHQQPQPSHSNNAASAVTRIHISSTRCSITINAAQRPTVAHALRINFQSVYAVICK